jgi:hypothetical protein
MGFQTYWRSLGPKDKREFARRAKTSVEYLALVSGGWRKAGPEFARRLVAASGNQLRLEDVRPDWAEVAANDR